MIIDQELIAHINKAITKLQNLHPGEVIGVEMDDERPTEVAVFLYGYREQINILPSGMLRYLNFKGPGEH